mmetsp:Transcript_105846/g.297618  ORF Transcript_105846/g.297618 Transcript_105846/m.297618 type:complete len:212 (-) Transcript_105846:300-935(-)
MRSVTGAPAAASAANSSSSSSAAIAQAPAPVLRGLAQAEAKTCGGSPERSGDEPVARDDVPVVAGRGGSSAPSRSVSFRLTTLTRLFRIPLEARMEGNPAAPALGVASPCGVAPLGVAPPSCEPLYAAPLCQPSAPPPALGGEATPGPSPPRVTPPSPTAMPEVLPAKGKAAEPHPRTSGSTVVNSSAPATKPPQRPDPVAAVPPTKPPPL